MEDRGAAARGMVHASFTDMRSMGDDFSRHQRRSRSAPRGAGSRRRARASFAHSGAFTVINAAIAPRRGEQAPAAGREQASSTPGTGASRLEGFMRLHAFPRKRSFAG
jgi:hypothetical protein